MRKVETEAGLAKHYERVGEWLEAVHLGRGCTGVEGMELTEVRIRLASEGDPMVLVIVKGTSPAGRHIAFVGAGSPNQALLAWRKRDGGSGLKWREDRPWGV